MHISFRGKPTDERVIRAGFIGCGSHSFRNVYPTFQFAPVELVATCDLDIAKAQAFAGKLGATGGAYDDYHTMLEKEQLDAVFVVTGYDKRGRPLYPRIATDCVNAGVHVWIEKPPAASVEELESLKAAADAANKTVLVGFKKMFFPANEKVKSLMDADAFGNVQLAMLQYPQHVPTVEEMTRHAGGEKVGSVVGFLDHLCHPMSLMVFLLGMPKTLYYERSPGGAGSAMFTYESGTVAQLALTRGASSDGGMERTVLVADNGTHIVVENNTRVSLHRCTAPKQYGASPDYYVADPGQTTAVWEPEFSLGQLYNKGLFLLGYYGEVNEFARCILDDRPPSKAHLDHAIQITRVFERFREGPGKVIGL